MLTTGQREIAVPGTGAHPPDSGSRFRRILVPVRSPGEAYPALAVAARICGGTSGVLRLVHVRSCDPLPISGRFYLETTGQATAVLKEALLAAWACGEPRATTAIVDARRGEVATAIVWQAAAWPADLIVLTRRSKAALTRLARGSVPEQVIRTASCPVLAIPPAKITASTAPPDLWHAKSGPSGARTPSRAGHRLPAGPSGGGRDGQHRTAGVGQAVAAARSAAISASPARKANPPGAQRDLSRFPPASR